MASPDNHDERTSATGSVSGGDHDKQSARNPACDSCREKKVRCGRERPTCQNCRTWKVRCTYSERQKRDNEASRNAQRFDDVNARLDRIEATMNRLVSAMETTMQAKASPCPATPMTLPSGVCRRCSDDMRLSSESQPSPVVHTPERPKSAKQKAWLKSQRTNQYLGSSSLLSITTEAGSLVEESLRSNTGLRVGDGKPWSEEQEAISALQNLSSISTEAARRYPYYGKEELRAGSDRATLEVPLQEEAEELVNEYFRTVHYWYPIFSEPLFRRDLEFFYTDGEAHRKMLRNRAWLTCFYNICLFGLYSKLSATEGTNWRSLPQNHRVSSFYWNAMAAMDQLDMFLTPRIRNVQALLTVAIVTVEVSRPGLCWSVLSQAARLAQAIGLHLSGARDAQTYSKAEIEERKHVFWNIYSLDKCLSLTFGRSPSLPDFDCDVELPEDDGTNPHFRNKIAMIHLAKIQSSIYVKLYSATAARYSPPQRESAIRDLDTQLREWWKEYEHLSADRESGERPLDSFERIELGFSYHSSLTLVHRMALPGMPSYAWNQSMCLESARTSMRMVTENAETDTAVAKSGMLMWLFHYYPFTSFFVLFSAIIRNPSAAQSETVDYQLMKGLVGYLEKMSANNEGAARLLAIASAFTHVAGTFLKNYHSMVAQSSSSSTNTTTTAAASSSINNAEEIHRTRKRRRDEQEHFTGFFPSNGNNGSSNGNGTSPAPLPSVGTPAGSTSAGPPPPMPPGASPLPPSFSAAPDGTASIIPDLQAAAFLRWPGMGGPMPPANPNAALAALRPPEVNIDMNGSSLHHQHHQQPLPQHPIHQQLHQQQQQQQQQQQSMFAVPPDDHGYEMDLETLMTEPLDFQTQMEQAAARGPLEFDWFSWDGQYSA